MSKDRDPAVHGRVTVILVPSLSPSGSWLLPAA